MEVAVGAGLVVALFEVVEFGAFGGAIDGHVGAFVAVAGGKVGFEEEEFLRGGGEEEAGAGEALEGGEFFIGGFGGGAVGVDLMQVVQQRRGRGGLKKSAPGEGNRREKAAAGR